MTSKVELKSNWKQFVVQQQPTALVTLTLRKWNRGITSDGDAIKLFNQLLWYTNRSLFRKRYDKGIEYLAGFAALEHQENGMPHVHMMITNDLDLDTLRAILEKHIPRFVHVGRGKNYRTQAEYVKKHKSGVPLDALRDEVIENCTSKTRLILSEGVDVRPIEQTERSYLRLSDYLQKEIDTFLLLDQHGLGLPVNVSTA